MKKATLTILAAFWVASLLVAQEPPSPPSPPDPATRAQHHVQFLTRQLSLNAGQQQQATTIFTNAATSEAALFQQMRSARQNLAGAVKNNDTGAIDQAAATIGNLTAQLTSAQAKAKMAFNQLLTPDQQSKLAQMESQRPHHRGPGGPGAGPGAFGHMGPGHMAPGPAEPPPLD
jgi:Spy/CpxP family protein refolding chaperone